MTIHSTPADVANTAVRTLLTTISKHYSGGATFDTSSGRGLEIWNETLENFGHTCAYCGEKGKMQREHLIQFNREECGLHIPANLVPSCNECNKKRSVGWEEWLKKICEEKGHSKKFEERKKKIKDHIDKHVYPELTNDEKKIIADFLEDYYANVSKYSEDQAKELVSKLEKKH